MPAAANAAACAARSASRSSRTVSDTALRAYACAHMRELPAAASGGAVAAAAALAPAPPRPPTNPPARRRRVAPTTARRIPADLVPASPRAYTQAPAPAHPPAAPAVLRARCAVGPSARAPARACARALWRAQASLSAKCPTPSPHTSTRARAHVRLHPSPPAPFPYLSARNPGHHRVHAYPNPTLNTTDRVYAQEPRRCPPAFRARAAHDMHSACAGTAQAWQGRSEDSSCARRVVFCLTWVRPRGNRAGAAFSLVGLQARAAARAWVSARVSARAGEGDRRRSERRGARGRVCVCLGGWGAYVRCACSACGAVDKEISGRRSRQRARRCKLCSFGARQRRRPRATRAAARTS